MHIYLIRHADAVLLGGSGLSTDAERPLSQTGISQASRLAAGFRAHEIHLGIVATSPLIRARQTAETLQTGLQLPNESLVVDAALEPGGSSKRLAKLLRGLGVDSAALVGHEPDMGEHAAWLIGSKKARITFAKAATACIVCAVDVRKGSGELLWMVTPEWLPA